MGEPAKVVLLDKVIEVIKRDDLLSLVQASGNVDSHLSYLFIDKNFRFLTKKIGKKMMEGLMDLSKRYPQHVKNVRGRGTFCAFDSSSPEKRDEIVAKLKEKGIDFDRASRITKTNKP